MKKYAFVAHVLGVFRTASVGTACIAVILSDVGRSSSWAEATMRGRSCVPDGAEALASQNKGGRFKLAALMVARRYAAIFLQRSPETRDP